MREILFRGRCVGEDDYWGWQEGYYVCLRDSYRNRESHRIYTGFAESDCGSFYGDWYEVDPKTVGQYTGLQTYWYEFENEPQEADVWEHDILEVDYDCKTITAVVRYEAGTFILCSDDFVDGYIPLFDVAIVEDEYYMTARKIGNIHDNPELLG